MKTRFLKADVAGMKAAAQALRRGQLVAFPTETVYGLGARALDAKAVKKIYRAKGRPSDNPLIVHVNGSAMMETVAHPTSLARKLIAAFWPGPLTLILKSSGLVPDVVTGGQETIAVRCPAHPFFQTLIDFLGEPIAAPSANLSGRPSPTTAAHVYADLDGRIALILDGGPCNEGLESTIIDARGRYPVLLRPGSLTVEDIARAAGVKVLNPGANSPASPGTRYRHYAPDCRVELVSPRRVREGIEALKFPKTGLIHRSPSGAPLPGFSRKIPGGLDVYARSLFASLREAESFGVKTLYVETVPKRGVGRAVMDRLQRAAGLSHPAQ